MKPKLNPLMQLVSLVLRPLRDEHVAALEDALADSQAATRRAEEEAAQARQEKETALGCVDDVNAHNARLHRELTEFREALPEFDKAMAALALRVRCGCRAGRGRGERS